MDGDDLVKGADGASATGMFGTVTREPEERDEPAAVSAPPTPRMQAEPASQASSGGFTQLLRALNYDQVKEQVKEAVAAAESKSAPATLPPEPQSPVPESAARSAAKDDVADRTAAPPLSSSQVTSFLPQSAPSPPPAAGGSFTQLFQTLDVDPDKEPKATVPSPSPISDASSEPPSSAGSFTQLFAVPDAPKTPSAAAPMVRSAQTPADSEVEPVAVPDPPRSPWMVDVVEEATVTPANPAPTHAPSSFTQIFQALDAPARPPAANPALTETIPPVNAPGSFTQMFQTLGAPPSEPVAPTPTPPVPVRSADDAPRVPGSFTQMFQALGTPAAEEPRQGTPPLVVSAPKEASPAAPGSFTQMFQTLAEPSAAPTARDTAKAGTPGSFTQMFGAVTESPQAVPPAPSSFERPFRASAPAGEEGGASQMFATYKEPDPEAGRPTFSPIEPPQRGQPPVSAPPASGGLTQLLRTLDQPASAPRPFVAPGNPPSYPPPGTAPMPSQAGSFTGIYGELGPPVSPVAPPAPPVAASQPESGAGSSEFTRLIQASAVREAALRGGGPAPPAVGLPGATPPAAPPAAGAGGAAFSMPAGAPVMPHLKVLTPAAPKLPEIKPPELAKAAAPAGGMQKYVPLLLILVIFLLLAILVAVVFLMKK